MDTYPEIIGWQGFLWVVMKHGFSASRLATVSSSVPHELG
jgi:hypothetical protein